MTRASRNERYHIQAVGNVPIRMVVRDVLLTCISWGLAIYFSWDFLFHLQLGILYEIDANPLNDYDWSFFARQLRISLLFSTSVLIFIGGWAVSNIYLLLRTRHLEGLKTEPLLLEEEVKAYGCDAESVKSWREEKVLTVSIDDEGNILSCSKATH